MDIKYIVVERLVGDRSIAYGPYDSDIEARNEKEKMPFSRATEGFDVIALHATHSFARKN